LVTPLRDGMNLVAKEYMVCQDPENPGVLILSRFAGAAIECDAGLLVNPYDPESVGTAIGQALAMPLDERRSRHNTLFQALAPNDVKTWGKRFLIALTRPLNFGHAPYCQKSPLRPDPMLRTLYDAAILIASLDPFRQARAVWGHCAGELMKAMETGKDADINEATRCLQVALNQENWCKG
jgi:Glycosyltransferase family 20